MWSESRLVQRYSLRSTILNHLCGGSVKAPTDGGVQIEKKFVVGVGGIPAALKIRQLFLSKKESATKDEHGMTAIPFVIGSPSRNLTIC